MKKLLVFIGVISTFPLFSQNYQLINFNDGIYYKAVNPFIIENYMWINHQSKFIISVKADSVINTLNQTSYYLYNTIEKKDSVSCFDVSKSHWLGKKIVEYNNGNYVLFNNTNDSIFFNKNANLNDSWILYKYADNSYIEAKVTSISYESFLTISDSIKTIELMHKDINNTIVSDIINGTTIKLSKNYGLIRFFSVRNFPDSFPLFEITGIQNLHAGNYIPTLAEIYDFNAGNSFHYDYRSITGNGSINNEMPYKEIRNIISKIVYNDSLTYTYERIRYFSMKSIQLHDTVSVTVHSIDSLPNFVEGVSGKMPLQSIRINSINVGQYSMTDDNYNHNLTLTFPEMEVQQGFNDTTCYDFWIPEKDIKFTSWEIGSRITYIKGLGILRKIKVFITNQQSPVCVCNPCEELLYFNKNGETWGTPLQVPLISMNNTNNVIYPNPANDEVNIISDHTIDEIDIYNILGEKIYNLKDVKADYFKLDVKKFTKGVYFICIKNINGLVDNNKLIVK